MNMRPVSTVSFFAAALILSACQTTYFPEPTLTLDGVTYEMQRGESESNYSDTYEIKIGSRFYYCGYRRIMCAIRIDELIEKAKNDWRNDIYEKPDKNNGHP